MAADLVMLLQSNRQFMSSLCCFLFQGQCRRVDDEEEVTLADNVTESFVDKMEFDDYQVRATVGYAVGCTPCKIADIRLQIV